MLIHSVIPIFKPTRLFPDAFGMDCREWDVIHDYCKCETYLELAHAFQKLCLLDRRPEFVGFYVSFNYESDVHLPRATRALIVKPCSFTYVVNQSDTSDCPY